MATSILKDPSAKVLFALQQGYRNQKISEGNKNIGKLARHATNIRFLLTSRCYVFAVKDSLIADGARSPFLKLLEDLGATQTWDVSSQRGGWNALQLESRLAAHFDTVDGVGTTR
jgi:hypothetical protein